MSARPTEGLSNWETARKTPMCSAYILSLIPTNKSLENETLLLGE